MAARDLQTAGEVIDALGGTTATAEITGRKAQHVSNWRASHRLPANTFFILRDELAKAGKTARPELWGFSKSDLERIAS